MELWEKIKTARDKAGLTQEDLAELCGVSRPSVSQWESEKEKGRTRPRDNMLKKIADATSVDYLYFVMDDDSPLTGSALGAVTTGWQPAVAAAGALFSIKGGQKDDEADGEYHYIHFDEDNERITSDKPGVINKIKKAFANMSGEVLIPYYKNTHVAAGNGSQVHDDEPTDTLAFQKSWINKMGLNPNHLVVVTCTGESMEPRISDGDIVLINTRADTIEDGRVYAINYSGEARIKRLIKRFDGSLIIRSDNQADEHKDEIVTPDMADQLKIIGKAVWVGGML